MTIAFARAHRLVPRGAAGLACDDDGVALGPMRLVEAVTDAAGCRRYRLRPAPEIAEALRLAYGSASNEIERCQRRFARIAQLLTAGERAQACIHAVQLAFPEIAPENIAKLAHAAALQKYNPNWEQEPRIPDGPGGGDWTSDGEGGRTGDANVRPAAAPANPVQAMKESFVGAHLADAQKAADQLGVPVENILGCPPWSLHGGPVVLPEKATTISVFITPHLTPPGICRPGEGRPRSRRSRAMPTV
jgi:hypothetical protein